MTQMTRIFTDNRIRVHPRHPCNLCSYHPESYMSLHLMVGFYITYLSNMRIGTNRYASNKFLSYIT